MTRYYTVMLVGSPGPGRPRHHHADGVVRGEDRDQCPQEEAHPALHDIDYLVVALAAGASCQKTTL